MNNTLNQEIERLENAKVKISNALISKEVSIPNNATLDTYDELINSIKVGTQSNEVTAKKANVLAGTKTITSDSNNAIVEGTMPNNGAVSPSALGAGGSYTIPAGYHNGSGKVTVQSLATITSAGDAGAGEILSGKKAYVDGNLLTGTMTNQGAKTSSLNCGGSYTIPAGYHNGSGKITANSLSSQTSATAGAGQILSGQTAWVNGSKITGSMANQGAQTKTYNASTSTQTYTIPAGYHNGSGKITFNPMKQYWVSQKVNGRDTFYDGSGNSTYCAYIEVNNLGFTPVAAGIEAANYYFITTGSDGTGNGRGYWPKAKNTNTISFTSSKVRLPLPYLTASSDMCYGFIIGY